MENVQDYMELLSQRYFLLNNLPVSALIFNKKGDLIECNRQALDFVGLASVLDYNLNRRIYNKNIGLFRTLIVDLEKHGTLSNRVLALRLLKRERVQSFIKCSGIKLTGEPDLYLFQFVEVSVFQVLMDKKIHIGLDNEFFIPNSKKEVTEQHLDDALSIIQQSFPSLSLNESICFGLVALGLTSKEIAENMNASLNAVNINIIRILNKLGMNKRNEIVTKFRITLLENQVTLLENN